MEIASKWPVWPLGLSFDTIFVLAQVRSAPPTMFVALRNRWGYANHNYQRKRGLITRPSSEPRSFLSKLMLMDKHTGTASNRLVTFFIYSKEVENTILCSLIFSTLLGKTLRHFLFLFLFHILPQFVLEGSITSNSVFLVKRAPGVC